MLWIIIATWRYCNHTGDWSLAEEFSENLQRAMDWLSAHDANNNGLFDAGETPIPGVTIALTGQDSSGNPVNRTTGTGSDGRYLFDDLRAGTYTISETQPAGYRDGTDTQGTPGTGTTMDDMFADITLGVGFLRTLRDLVNPRIEKIRIDSRETFQKVEQFVQELMPGVEGVLEHYPGERPGAEPQPLHRHFNQPMGIVIQGAEFRNLSIRQSGVAQRLRTGHPFLLFFPGP